MRNNASGYGSLNFYWK